MSTGEDDRVMRIAVVRGGVRVAMAICITK